MPKFTATVPLNVEYSSSYDTSSFSTEQGVSIDTEAAFKIGPVEVAIRQDEGQIVMTLGGFDTATQERAAEAASEILNLVVPALSLDFQTTFENQHYGHPRFGWRTRDLQIHQDLKGSIGIQASVSMKSTQTFAVSRTVTFVESMHSNPSLAFLVRSYYQALAPTDLRSKFYNAFVVIEYIEHSTSIVTRPMFKKSEVETLSEALSSTSISIGRARSILGDLSRKTNESRLDKLCEIVHSSFGIKSVVYATNPVDVDKDFIKKILNARNALFHAKPDLPDDFKRLTDVLILLVERIVVSLLEPADPS